MVKLCFKITYQFTICNFQPFSMEQRVWIVIFPNNIMTATVTSVCHVSCLFQMISKTKANSLQWSLSYECGWTDHEILAAPLNIRSVLVGVRLNSYVLKNILSVPPHAIFFTRWTLTMDEIESEVSLTSYLSRHIKLDSNSTWVNQMYNVISLYNLNVGLWTKPCCINAQMKLSCIRC